MISNIKRCDTEVVTFPSIMGETSKMQSSLMSRVFSETESFVCILWVNKTLT